jgi:hypothetical protein
MMPGERNTLLIDLFTIAKSIPDPDIPENLVLALLPVFESHKEDDVYPLLLQYNQVTAIIEITWAVFRYAKTQKKLPDILNREKEYTALYEMLVNCALSVEALYYEEHKK